MFFSECLSTSQSKWKMSSKPQKQEFLFLYSRRLNLLKYMGLPIIESSYNIYFLYSNLRTSMGQRSFHGRKYMYDNNVFKGSTFVINGFTYYSNSVKTKRLTFLYSLLLNFFQVMKQIIKQDGEPFPKRKLVSVQNIEHKD